MNKILMFCIIVLAFTACDSDKKSNAKTKVTVLGESAASIQSMMALEKAYETQNPSIDLDFKPLPFEDAFNKANQDFANGTGLYDIVMQYSFSLSSFVRNEYVYNIDELLAKIPAESKAFEVDLFPNAWKEVGFYQNKRGEEPKKVGYPFASNTMFIAYNKALFDDPAQKAAYKNKYKEELVVPTTWEQFANVAAFFNQPQNQISGVCLQGASGGWLYYEWMNFLFGMGGKVMDKQYGWQGDENTKVLLNTPEALKALKYYLSLKPYNAGNFTNVDSYAQIKMFKENKIALAIIWSDVAYTMIANADNTFDTRFGFAPIPGDKSLLAGGSYFINKKSKNPEVALKYIVDLMQPKMQVELTKKGLCSASRAAYEDPEVQKIPYCAAMKSSLERGVYMVEAGIDATMILEKTTTYLQKAWSGELSPEKALAKLQAEIEAERTKIFAALNTK